MQTTSSFQFFLSAIKNILSILFQNLEVLFCVLLIASVFDFLLFSGYQAINSFYAGDFIVPLAQHYSKYTYAIIDTIKNLFVIITLIQYVSSRLRKNPVSIFQALSFAANKKLFIIWMTIVYLGARIITFTILGLSNIFLGIIGFLLVICAIIFCLSVWYVVLVAGSQENITRHNAFVKSQQLTKGRRLPVAGVSLFLSFIFLSSVLFVHFLVYLMDWTAMFNNSNISIPIFSLITNSEIILMAISMVSVYFLLLTDAESRENQLAAADAQNQAPLAIPEESEVFGEKA